MMSGMKNLVFSFSFSFSDLRMFLHVFRMCLVIIID